MADQLQNAASAIFLFQLATRVTATPRFFWDGSCDATPGKKQRVNREISAGSGPGGGPRKRAQRP